MPTKHISSLLYIQTTQQTSDILSHSITPSDTVRNLGVTFDSAFNFWKHVSQTCRSCFCHIRDLRRISLSVAKTIATIFITSRLDYCNSILYNIAYKDILEFQYVQNCLARVSSVFPFCPTSEISSLAPGSISHHFQSLHYCLSNSFFWRTFISILHAFFITQAQRASFIWFSLVVCYQG